MSQPPNTVPQTAFPGQIRGCLLLADGAQVQRPGAAIQISATVAGTVNLVFWDGTEIVVNVQVGDSLYPYQVLKATAGTATISAFYNLFT